MDNLKKGTSILHYWTIRYLLIISVGLLITTIATFWWIQEESMENRMQTTGLLAQEFADLSVSNGSILPICVSSLQTRKDRCCSPCPR
jgi:hypothetical protein